MKTDNKTRMNAKCEAINPSCSLIKQPTVESEFCLSEQLIGELFAVLADLESRLSSVLSCGYPVADSGGDKDPSTSPLVDKINAHNTYLFQLKHSLNRITERITL